jgi:hypothetical protein
MISLARKPDVPMTTKRPSLTGFSGIVSAGGAEHKRAFLVLRIVEPYAPAGQFRGGYSRIRGGKEFSDGCLARVLHFERTHDGQNDVVAFEVVDDGVILVMIHRGIFGAVDLHQSGVFED